MCQYCSLCLARVPRPLALDQRAAAALLRHCELGAQHGLREVLRPAAAISPPPPSLLLPLPVSLLYTHAQATQHVAQRLPPPTPPPPPPPAPRAQRALGPGTHDRGMGVERERAGAESRGRGAVGEGHEEDL